ncbi:MAG: asparagine synthase (glutamine-hydrolyzing) [Oscillospiraceae bacterium]|nr:asparagine synthase (glutamine-hydrolyzing) [Oscillospiraceae bacterium]
MCGIAGMVGLTADRDTQQKILATMARRGPDGNGVYQDDHCTLLHTRLAIIDPAGGAQPMTAGNMTIVYNGELYNTARIRRELEKLGHCFRTNSDTEVVLRGYAQWGADCVHRFNGIFAFAIWDGARLFLARDRIGVKPLFYKLHGGGLLFGSEIKNILAYPTVRAELDEEGAAELLLLGPGRTPGCGVFRGIRELEPGWCGYYENGKLGLNRYWHLADREHTDTFGETVEKVRYLVTDAVKRQMVSDVPIGTFLSGGLDSSLITAICAGETEHLPTFSVDYENNDRYFTPNKFQPNSDGHYIRLMQNSLHTDHHWTVLTPEDLVGALEDATIARDLPGMADVDFSLLLFCRDIRREVKVALSGECADEIFGGYPWYRDPEVRSAEGFPWAQNITQRTALLSRELKIDGAAYVHDRYRDTCRESDILPGASAEERRMKEMVNLNFRWFMQTLLDRKDRMSMYSGLEVRVPFCDWRIAEYLYAVPWEFKDHRGKEKGLLRTAMAGMLPEEVLWRKKSPYPKTWDPGYMQILSGRLRALLEDNNAPIFHLIRREEAAKLLTAKGEWPWYGQLMREPQTVSYLLQLDFWLRHYGVQFTF